MVPLLRRLVGRLPLPAEQCERRKQGLTNNDFFLALLLQIKRGGENTHTATSSGQIQRGMLHVQFLAGLTTRGGGASSRGGASARAAGAAGAAAGRAAGAAALTAGLRGATCKCNDFQPRRTSGPCRTNVGIAHLSPRFSFSKHASQTRTASAI